MVSSVGASALALLTGWLGYVFGVRQEREKERRSRNFMAAAELVAPLREFQRLLRRFGRDEVDKDAVTDAFLAWSRAYDDHGHRLPRAWRHVARSVRAATGTAFGGVSLVHIRPESGRLGLTEPDAMWQDFADDYLEYAAARILFWGDSGREAPNDLTDYDAWLVRTERWEPHRTIATRSQWRTTYAL